MRVIAFERPSSNSNCKFRSELLPRLKFGMPREIVAKNTGRGDIPDERIERGNFDG